MITKEAKDAIEFHAELEDRFYPHKPLMQEVGKYIIPRRMFDKEMTPGDSRMDDLYDTTAVEECANLAAIIQSMLFNLYTTWLVYEVLDMDNPTYEERKWCDIASATLSVRLQQTNLSLGLDETTLDLVGFGNGILVSEPGKRYPGGYNFQSMSVEFCRLLENDYGIVDVLSRRIPLSKHQFGLKFGKDPSGQYADKDTIWVIHQIKPRAGGVADAKDPKKLPFSSIYVEEKSGELIDHSGYKRFRVYCPRWRKAAGEEYGRGIGEIALPVAREANRLAPLLTDHLELGMFGPLDAQVGAYDKQLNFNRLAVNFRNFGREKASPLLVTKETQQGEYAMEKLQNTIRRIFFMDKLFLIDKDRMTTDEVRQRISENMQVVGPTFGRWDYELLTPFANNVLQDYYEMGLLPKAPSSLLDGSGRLNVKFVSPLAQTMRGYEVRQIERTMSGAATLIQYKPELVDNVDLDEEFREYWLKSGRPAKRLVPIEVRDKGRADRQKMMMAQFLAQTMGGKNLSGGGQGA